jgi:hypothetical protein
MMVFPNVAVCPVSGQNLYYSMDAQVEQVKKVMEVDSASE